MIPVPSYQVVQFLDWLRERQVRLSRERFNRDQLHRLAIEYLRSADIGKGEFARIDLLFLLRVFQSCPMIGESGVLAQMEHFARCGQCMEYIREREHGYLVTGLHPLLREFLTESGRSGFRERVDRELDDERVGLRGRERLHAAIRRIGSELEQEFRDFVAKCPPTLVRNYEVERGPGRRRDDRPGDRRRDEEDGTKPISLEDGPEQAAYRLVSSLEELLTGSYYDQTIVTDHQLCRFLSNVTDFPENLAQSLEFLAWVLDEQPVLDLDGDIPSDKVRELVQCFCEAKQYSNAASFGREVARWMSGEGSETVLQRIRRFLSGRRHDTHSRLDRTPFRRYQSVRMHGMFLFLSTGDFPTFIDRHWRDLNALTGNALDVYFSEDDLKTRVSGYETLSEFKSLQVSVVQLPAIILWEQSLKLAQAVPLGKLEHDDIMEVMKHLVHKINGGSDLKTVVSTATDFAGSLMNDKKSSVVEIVKTKIVIERGDNIMHDKYEVSGQAGAVGPHAHAHDITFNQLWHDQSKNLELPVLAQELERIRRALRDEPASAENDIAIGAVANAEVSAKDGNGAKALEYLKTAGKAALACAEKIGTGVAIAAIKAAMGV